MSVCLSVETSVYIPLAGIAPKPTGVVTVSVVDVAVAEDGLEAAAMDPPTPDFKENFSSLAMMCLP